MKFIKLYYSLILLSLTTANCVYYNTFYLAEKFYSEGMDAKKTVQQSTQRRGVPSSQKFDMAIEKCTKVLVRFPGSDYVDDALLLMGKAFFQKESYTEAEITFDKFMRVDPDEDLLAEAFFWKGMTQFKLGNNEAAIGDFNNVTENFPKSDWADDAQYYKGNVYYEAERHSAAIVEYEKLVKNYGDSKLRDQALLKVARSKYTEKNFESALEDFRTLSKDANSDRIRREGQWWTANTLRKLNRQEEALEVYNHILKSYKKLPPDEMTKVQLSLNETLIESGDYFLALENLTKIAEEFPSTEHAAEALYRKAEIFLAQDNDAEKAREEFLNARDAAPQSEYGKLAEERYMDIARMTKLKEILASPPDSTTSENPERLAAAQFSIAELTLFNMNNPAEAATEYQKVMESYPDSPWAPKAAFSAAWIFQNYLNDSDTAEKIYQKLLDRYPETRYADEARQHLGLPVPERTVGFYGDELAGLDPLKDLVIEKPPTKRLSEEERRRTEQQVRTPQPIEERSEREPELIKESGTQRDVKP